LLAGHRIAYFPPVRNFVHETLPARVVFGAGAVQRLSGEIERLGARRVLLISTPGRAAMVSGLGIQAAGVFDRAVMHTPREKVEEARALAAEVAADCCVVVGGGSTIGFGKAIALTSGLPIIAVPTTYSGSEMTTIWGISEGGAKKTGRHPRVLPRTVIYDPELTVGLSAATSAASGMNAIAHCAEALYAHDGNPIISLMAEEGIRALSASLPQVVSNGKDISARTDALYGAWLAGAAIATTSVALHHKLCHVLGGLGLPHAETHSIILPHALRYNAAAAAEAMERIARALKAADAARGVWDLERTLGLPMRLADIGMNEADLERAARIAVQAPYPNPRPLEYEAVLSLLRNAYTGTL
jgi:alcohol dehydrogenase class IV